MRFIVRLSYGKKNSEAVLVVETLFKEETFEESKNIFYAFPHALGGNQKPVKSGAAVSFGE